MFAATSREQQDHRTAAFAICYAKPAVSHNYCFAFGKLQSLFPQPLNIYYIQCIAA